MGHTGLRSGKLVTLNTNGGLRKLCDCPRRGWAKCAHSWFLNYQPRDRSRRNPDAKDGNYRFSLDRALRRHVADKSEAEREAHKFRVAIDAGTFNQPAPQLDGLTVGHLLDVYKQRHVDIERKDSAQNVAWQMALIKKTEIERPDGRAQPLGEWLMADLTTTAIDRFKEIRLTRGTAAANRDLALLRAAFNWGIRTRHIKESPFKLGTETVIKLSAEHARNRRLGAEEATALLAACSPPLRALVECALETGMRRGEILSLQWKQVLGLSVDEQTTPPTLVWAPKAELFLPHSKTKTAHDRTIPISTRLRAILDMRRLDPAGQPHGLDAFVFGSEVGTRVAGFKRAWHTAVLKANGLEPTYTATANLSPESRAAFAKIDLHFHDLRREAGSRWLDGGMALHAIRDLLGHANVSQTSVYLSTTTASLHEAMEKFEGSNGTSGTNGTTGGLQQLATEAETGGKTKPRSAARRHKKARKGAVGRAPAIM